VVPNAHVTVGTGTPDVRGGEAGTAYAADAAALVGAGKPVTR